MRPQWRISRDPKLSAKQPAKWLSTTVSRRRWDRPDNDVLRSAYQWHGVDHSAVLQWTGERRRRLEYVLGSRLQHMYFGRKSIKPPLTTPFTRSTRHPWAPPVEIGLPDFDQAKYPGLKRSARLYEELPCEDSIRILEIQQGSGHDPVVCRLHTVRLHDKDSLPEFEALSYVWGVTKSEEKILCNGHAVAIGENLLSALQQLRLATRSRFVWADAICINQDNLEERSHQVSIMRKIYQGAHRVIAWVGNNDQNAEVVLSLLCSVINSHYAANLATFKKNGEPLPVSYSAKPELDDFDTWYPTSRFYELPYFWRLWIIQEVALARFTLLVWGDYEIAWEWIGLAAALIRTNHANTLGGNGVNNAYFIYRISRNQSIASPLSVSFLQLLSLTRQFETTDERDRIYGTLGLPTTDTPPIKPDYTLSTSALYQQLAESFLRRPNCLRILSAVQHSPRYNPSARRSLLTAYRFARHYHKNKQDCPPRYQNKPLLSVFHSLLSTPFPPSYPSWIPQWSTATSHALTPFDTSQSHSASSDIPMRRKNSSRPNVLTLSGIEIDTVTDVLPSYTPPHRDGIRTDVLPALFRATPPLKSYLKTREGIKLLARTLTAGKDWYGMFISDDENHLRDFAAYMRYTRARERKRRREKQDGSGRRNGRYVYTPPGIDTRGSLAFQHRHAMRLWEGYMRDGDPYSLTAWRLAVRLVLPDVGVGILKGSPGGVDEKGEDEEEEVWWNLTEMGDSEGGNAERFHAAAGLACVGRRLFVTEKGFLGLGPACMMEGDRVVVLFGGEVPFVVRRLERGCALLGECYVEGLMKGEGVEEFKKGRVKERDFEIL